MLSHAPLNGLDRGRQMPAPLIRRLVALTLLACPAILTATTVKPLTDQELVKKAELIFQGVVVRKEYRMSTVRTSTDAYLPHTFVTFQVERILKGKYSGTSSQFTLRLTGGSNPITKRFMLIEGCPDFDIGERVVLFVSKNERALCPIAGWGQGRFRIVGDSVFSDSGREVWLTSPNRLALGPRRDLEEARSHYRGGGVYVYSVAGSDSSEAGTPPPVAGTRLNFAAFINYVAWRIKTSHTASELSQLSPVTSPSAGQPFYVGRLRAVGGS